MDKRPLHQIPTSRRDAMKMIAAGSTGGLLWLLGSPLARAENRITPPYAHGMAPVKIKSVKAITTAPAGSNLIVVKVETTEEIPAEGEAVAAAEPAKEEKKEKEEKKK